MKWFVYIIECADKTLYTGITNNMKERLFAHQSGKGAKYTRGRGPFKLVLQERYRYRGLALKREIHIKRLCKKEKLRLINSQDVETFCI